MGWIRFIRMRPVFESVAIRDGGSFACHEFRGAAFDCPYHVHPELEITWIDSGNGQRLVGDCMEEFSPGDFVMHGEGLPHSYRNWSPEATRSHYIQFRRTMFGKELFGAPEFLAINDLFDRAARGIIFSKKTAKQAKGMIKSLFQRPAGLKKVILFFELLEVLASDSDARYLAGVDYASEADPAMSERMRRVLAYIEDNWNVDLRLEAVAKAAALHPRSMSRLFKHRTGRTFQEHLIELRLGRAARKLLESDEGISEIAFASGFNNLSNFNRLFLRCYKLSPGAYRRSIASMQNQPKGSSGRLGFLRHR